MDYECQTIPFGKLQVNQNGILEPLCNDCQAPDCSHPIHKQTVYVMGVPQQMRLWVSYNQVRQVVMCKGYVGDHDASLSDAEEN